LLDAIDVLREVDVHYAVIGAMAASVHGVVRASMDADAILALTTSELPDLERRFRAHGLKTELRHGDSDDPIAAVLAVTDSFGNRVDLLVGLRGLDPGVFARTLEVAFQGEQLRVAGREDFIAMKLFAHGPQDLVDAAFALAAGAGTLDMELLERLAARYGPETLAALQKALDGHPSSLGDSQS
jgi:hypothetical protein